VLTTFHLAFGGLFSLPIRILRFTQDYRIHQFSANTLAPVDKERTNWGGKGNGWKRISEYFIKII